MAHAPLHPRTERLTLFAILAVAAALRLMELDVAPGFSGDEGYEAFYGWQVSEHRVFQMNPVRPYLGPWFLWVMAPFIGLIGVGPFAARLPVALMGVAAVALAWAVGKRLGGPRAGLGSGLLMATMPFAVLFSRLSLSVATTPFWVLLVVWLLLRLLDRPGSLGRGLALGLAVGAAVSFHPQGLLLGPVCAVVALALPTGRELLRKPGTLLAAAVGFSGFAWVVWVMILDQVGLGPGIDYSGTWVGQKVSYSLPQRLLRSFPQMMDGFVGGRILHWFAGPSSKDPPLEQLGWFLSATLVLALGVALLRGQSRHARALGLGLATAWGLTVLRSADFDLGGLTRERYLLTSLTLTVPLLGFAASALPPRWRRWSEGALTGLATVGFLGVTLGFFGPLKANGGDAEPSFVVATPDAKVQAADWMNARLQAGEQGLLLAGDGWSYWPLTALLGERFPTDFVPEDPAACAAVLRRTDNRRRWLVDYPGWHWTRTIQQCLELAGRPGIPPAFVPAAQGGKPALYVWELPPGSLGAAPTPHTP